MSPDVEELIQKINTLTVDKNRLRQKLAQLTNSSSVLAKSGARGITQTISNDSIGSAQASSRQNSTETRDLNDNNQINSRGPTADKSTISSTIRPSEKIIAGVECSSSCEDDMLFMNELLKKKLDEYIDNWDYLQSKCAALMSELNALQKHHTILKREKSELEEKFRSKCDDYDSLKSELQTVVLNYETQLSAMSEHLSMITNRASLADQD